MVETVEQSKYRLYAVKMDSEELGKHEFTMIDCNIMLGFVYSCEHVPGVLIEQDVFQKLPLRVIEWLGICGMEVIKRVLEQQKAFDNLEKLIDTVEEQIDARLGEGA